MCLALTGCVATPKVSQWISPPDKHLSLERVFDAAVVAGTENKFTIMNSEGKSGVISMKNEEYGDKKSHKEITNNFYVYLFRELDINNQDAKIVKIADENATELDTKPTQAFAATTGETKGPSAGAKAESSGGATEVKKLAASAENKEQPNSHC